MSDWTHDSLAADLAGHLRGDGVMVWCDVQLGPAASPRPDVYVLHTSFVRPNPIAYEVKVSRSDFLADVTEAKWSKYLAYAGSVWFAAPEGLLQKGEIPDRAGLMVRGADKWRALKRPIPNPLTSIPQEALLKLIMEGRPAVYSGRRANASPGESFAKKFGWEAARYVSDKISFMGEIERLQEDRNGAIKIAEERAKQIRDQALNNMPSQYKALCAALGLPETTDRFKIQDAIMRVRNKRAGPEKEALVELVGHLRNLVARYERLTKEEETT